MSNHLNGLSNTKLYRKHRAMLERCNNPKHKSYSDYGGRGIKVCNEWQGKEGFLNFYGWAARVFLLITYVNIGEIQSKLD